MKENPILTKDLKISLKVTGKVVSSISEEIKPVIKSVASDTLFRLLKRSGKV